MICLRRAVSSCYYALFHCLARDCADLLIGGRSSVRSKEAWRQVYRSLDHSQTKDRCKDSRTIARFPRGIAHFASMFVALQQKRHEADYDPFQSFKKSRVESDLLLVEETIRNFRADRLVIGGRFACMCC